MSGDPFEVSKKTYDPSTHTRKQNAGMGAVGGTVYGSGAALLGQGAIKSSAKKMAANSKNAGGTRYAKARNLVEDTKGKNLSPDDPKMHEANNAKGFMRKLESKMSTKQKIGLKGAKLIGHGGVNRVGITAGVIGTGAALGAGEGALRRHKKAPGVSKAFNPVGTARKFASSTKRVIQAPESMTVRGKPLTKKNKVKTIGALGADAYKHDKSGTLVAGGVAAGAVGAGGYGAYKGKKKIQDSVFKSKNITYHQTAGVRSRRTARKAGSVALLAGGATMAVPGGRRFAGRVGHAAMHTPTSYKTLRGVGVSRGLSAGSAAKVAGHGVKNAAKADPIPAGLAATAGVTGAVAGGAATKSRHHGRQEQKLRRNRKAKVTKMADPFEVNKAFGAMGAAMKMGSMGATKAKGFAAGSKAGGAIKGGLQATGVKAAPMMGKAKIGGAKLGAAAKANPMKAAAIGGGAVAGVGAAGYGAKKTFGKSAFGVEDVDKSFRRKKDKDIDIPNADRTGWKKQRVTSIENPKSVRRRAAVGGAALGGAAGLIAAGPIGAAVGGAGGAALAHQGTKYGYAHKKTPKKAAPVSKSAFGVEHVSKAKSENGLLGNARGDGKGLLHSGRGGGKALLHSGRSEGKGLLHSGKGGKLVPLLKDGRAEGKTALGAK